MEEKTSKKELKRRVKQLEYELREKEGELERIISVFLNHIPHEIRTPLNAIVGFSYLLSQKELSQKNEEEYIKILSNNTKDLTTLVENLVDLSLLKSNQLKVKIKKFALNDLMDELYAGFLKEKVNLEKHGIALLQNVPIVDNPIYIYSDQARLNQIFTILINNAFRFTEKGIIEFGFSEDNADSITFFVKDSGCGIAKEERDSIFNSFIKRPGPPSEDNRGLGLGLSVAKGILEVLGGEIKFESENEKGCLFSFVIPRHKEITRDKISLKKPKVKPEKIERKVGRNLAI